MKIIIQWIPTSSKAINSTRAEDHEIQGRNCDGAVPAFFVTILFRADGAVHMHRGTVPLCKVVKFDYFEIRVANHSPAVLLTGF